MKIISTHPSLSHVHNSTPDSTPTNGELSQHIKNPQIVTTLDNGLTVITQRFPYNPICKISNFVRAGSVFENNENSGSSHFLEHMLFRGTKTRTRKDIVEEVEDVGGFPNATTSIEQTCYYTTVLGEYIQTPISVFLDMLFNPALHEEDLEREKKVILEEANAKTDNPGSRSTKLIYRVFFKGHPLERPVIGTSETITNMNLGDLNKIHSERYTPNNIVISLAGNLNHDVIVKEIDNLTSHIKTTAVLKDNPIELTFNLENEIEDMDIGQAHLNITIKGFPVHNDKRYILHVISSALGGSASSRLKRTIREERGFAYSISSGIGTNSLGGFLNIQAKINPANTLQVIDLILKELQIIKRDGISPKELERAKVKSRTNLLSNEESISSRADMNGYYFLFFKKLYDLEDINHKIQKITNEDVIKVANEVFDCFSITVLGPKDKLPSKAELARPGQC